MPDHGVVVIGLHHPALQRRAGKLRGPGGVDLRQAHARAQEERIPQAPPLLDIPPVEYIAHLGGGGTRRQGRRGLLQLGDQVSVNSFLGIVGRPYDLI